MFILSIKLSFCFQLIPFLENSLFQLNKYKLLEKRLCVSVWVCFAPTMQNVAPDTINLVLKKKKKTHKKTAFGFEKKQTKKTTKKNKTKKHCWGRIPGFHLSDKKKVYLWTLDYGGGVGEALRLFFGKHVLAILKTYLTRLELKNYSRMFTNL